MTITYNCESNDCDGSVNLVDMFKITEIEGVPLKTLKQWEIQACGSLFQNHVWDHPGHRATFKFSVPPGYEKREGIIYRSVVET